MLKEQYVGDANDYRKYALLRLLADGGKVKIGVAWMLTAPDGGNDGNKLAYLDQPTFRQFDPPVFDLLKSVSVAAGGRRLSLIEESGILPGGRYFNSVLPDGLLGRLAYFAEMQLLLSNTDLIFFDPDNGLDISSRSKGSKNSSKYIYRDEIAATFAAGRSVLIYQHFPRQERGRFVGRLGAELADLCQGSAVWAFSSPHVVFLLVVAPGHLDTIAPRANSTSHWPASFFRGQRLV